MTRASPEIKLFQNIYLIHIQLLRHAESVLTNYYTWMRFDAMNRMPSEPGFMLSYSGRHRGIPQKAGYVKERLYKIVQQMPDGRLISAWPVRKVGRFLAACYGDVKLW